MTRRGPCQPLLFCDSVSAVGEGGSVSASHRRGEPERGRWPWRSTWPCAGLGVATAGGYPEQLTKGLFVQRNRRSSPLPTASIT